MLLPLIGRVYKRSSRKFVQDEYILNTSNLTMTFGDEISVMSEGKCIMSMLLSFLTFFFFYEKKNMFEITVIQPHY